METLQSNVEEATKATRGIKDIEVDKGSIVDLKSSTAHGMQKGQEFCNRMVRDLSKLTECVKKQAKKFPDLAQVIENRDTQDAKQLGGQ